jgi:cadmium resistance transport/sequestration family protein
VPDLLGTVVAAAGVFAGTNVDDLIVLTVLFLAARASGRPKAWQVWAGQYGGIAILVLVSGLGALGLNLVPDRWVGLLGLVPLGLGVRGLIAAVRRTDGEGESPVVAGSGDGGGGSPVVAGSAFAVAGVTIANGADNIAVYTPLFRTIGATGTVITVVVFAVLIAVWCLAASWLGSHRRVIAVVERWGHWLVPVVFVVIGAVIVAESGVLGELFPS